MSNDSLSHKQFKVTQRKQRTRARIFGTAERPRLAVRITNKQIVAQLINDQEGKTIAYAATSGQQEQAKMSDKAAWLGGEIAKKAQQAKIKRVVFDRSSHKYHGRVKSLADAARSSGLEF